MASGSKLWWRAWVESAQDPKLLSLRPQLRWYWYQLLCLAKCGENGALPCTCHVRSWLRLRTDTDTEAVLKKLQSRGLFEFKDGQWFPHNWERRQYVDSTAAERKRRQRERDSHGTSRRDSHAPEQSRAETEKKDRRGAHNGEHPPNGFAERKTGAYLPEDWQPSKEDIAYAQQHHLDGQQLTNEAEKFRKHWHGEAGQKARKRNWHAAWCKWVLNARPGTQSRPNQPEGFRF